MFEQPLLIPISAPLSWVYSLGLSVDRIVRSRRARALSKPVFSIGNITLGGTGKTPFLLRLVDDLQKIGLKPAILTRGYRGIGEKIEAMIVTGNLASSALLSDEVRLMNRQFPQVPIGVGPDRASSAFEMASHVPIDLFILDDGFQHWPLQRVWNAVCVDATDPWGGGHLVPWGRLREPVSSLRRASHIFLTRAELVTDRDVSNLSKTVKRIAPDAQLVVTSFSHRLRSWQNGQDLEMASLQNRVVVAVSSIGHPESYERNLEQMGARVIPCRFPDHHMFTELDLDQIEKRAAREQAHIVITTKDEMKLRQSRWNRSQMVPDSLTVLEASLRIEKNSQGAWDELLYDVKKRALPT